MVIGRVFGKADSRALFLECADVNNFGTRKPKRQKASVSISLQVSRDVAQSRLVTGAVFAKLVWRVIPNFGPELIPDEQGRIFQTAFGNLLISANFRLKQTRGMEVGWRLARRPKFNRTKLPFLREI